MELRTASQAFSTAKTLEAESASYYESLAAEFSEHAELFGALAKENHRFVTQIERVYYGVITDAIEGGFAFDMDVDEYTFDTAVPDDVASAAARALEIEDKIIGFYTQAADQSRALMADLPRAFDQVVKRRRRRLPELEKLVA